MKTIRWCALLLLSLALFLPGSTATSCPFCAEERGPTLAGDFAQASLVLVGTFRNAKVGAGALDPGTTEFFIEKVLKSHEILKDP